MKTSAVLVPFKRPSITRAERDATVVAFPKPPLSADHGEQTVVRFEAVREVTRFSLEISRRR